MRSPEKSGSLITDRYKTIKAVGSRPGKIAVKDSFGYADEIVFQQSKLFMGSLNVDSLFTNIPLKETISICTNLLYNNVDVIESINKSEFENLLYMATHEPYFMLQIDGGYVIAFRTYYGKCFLVVL